MKNVGNYKPIAFFRSKLNIKIKHRCFGKLEKHRCIDISIDISAALISKPTTIFNY